ncbi:hypothetical protein DLREEDagrD3_20420 [Denitratisoma sp. agr-D3]
MKISPLLLVASLAVSLSTQAADTPSISLAQDALSSIWSRKDKCVKVSAFEKTDGQSSEVFGIHSYVMDYKAQLTFIAPCYAEYDAERKKFSMSPHLKKPPFMNSQSKLFQPGEAVVIVGKLHFVKKESGWHKQ